MKKFIIDIDGVIGKTRKLIVWDKKTLMNIEPNKKIINKINQLHSECNEIVLFTARPNMARAFTMSWLTKIGVKYNNLVMGKPEGDYYIDDRMISVADFLK